MQRIGTVERIMRYPVKGMGGEELDSVQVLRHGLEGDRLLYFARKGVEGKPSKLSINIRDFPRMLLFRAHFNGFVNGRVSVSIVTPAGLLLDPRSETAFSAVYSGAISSPRGITAQIELRETRSGFHDSSPVSLVGMQSIASVARSIPKSIDPLRFRENFYIRWDVKSPFFEDELIGRRIRIGEAVLKITKRDHRCVVTTVNPATGRIDISRLLRYLPLDLDSEKKKPSMGVYADVENVGQVMKSEAVFLL